MNKLIALTLRTLHKTAATSRIKTSVAGIPVAAAMVAVLAAILIPQPARAATFGITTVGSTNYLQTTVGTTATDTQNSAGNYFVADPFTVTAPLTAKTIFTYGSVAGTVSITIYNDNSGSPGTKLFTEVAYTSTANGWSTISIPNTYLAAGSYWVVYNMNSSSASANYITKKTVSGFVRKDIQATYGTAFPASGSTWSSLNSGFASCIYFVGVPVEGYAKAIKATLPAAGGITAMGFYSHATGDYRLAIYSDSSGPAVKQWESGDTTAAAGAWNTVNISAGTPTTLSLSAGTYWLAWQWNSANSGPSYAAGTSGNGNYVARTYGSFPAPWSGGTSSSEAWSIYAIYTAPSSTALSSSPNPSTAGQSVTFTATVTGTGGTPTGTVTFMDGGTNLGTGTLNGSGVATFSTTPLSAGSHTITAAYGGDSTFTGSTSSSVSQTVNAAAASKLVFTSTAVINAAGVASGTITVQQQDPYGNPNSTDPSRTATLSSSSTGTVTFNPTSLTIPNGSSTATFTYTDTKAGTPTITAASTSPSTITSATQVETVNAAAASLLVFTSTAVTATAGVASGAITVQRQDPYGNANTTDAARIVTLSSTSGGTVTFTPSSLSIAPGSSSATFSYMDTQAGTPTITAASTSPSTITSATQQETVSAAPATKLVFTSTAVTMAAGVASSAITVQRQDQYGNTNTADATRTVTLSSTSGGTVTFTPSSLSITNGSSSATFTYTDTQPGRRPSRRRAPRRPPSLRRRRSKRSSGR